MSVSNNWQNDQDQSASNNSGQVDILKVIFRRKMIILFFGAVGSAIGYLQYTKLPPFFVSNAQIQLIQQNNNLPIDDGRNSINNKNQVTVHTEVIKSPSILEPAVEMGNLKSLPRFANATNPAALLASGLSVSTKTDLPDILYLSFQSSNREECEAALKAIINSYTVHLGDSQSYEFREALNQINIAKDTLLKEIAEKEKSYSEFKAQTELVLTGENNSNIHQTRMMQIENTRSNLRIRLSQLKAELQSIQDAIRKGSSREALTLMINNSQVLQNNNNSDPNQTKSPFSIKQQLVPLLLEKETLMETHGVDHPKVVSIEKKINFMRNVYSESLDNIGDNSPKKDFLSVYMESLIQEIDSTQKKEKELDGLFDAERESAKLLSTDEKRNKDYQNDIKRSEDLFYQVLKKIEVANLNGSNNGIRVAQLHPPSPAYRIIPGMEQYLGVGAVGGMFLGLLIGYLLELADKGYRSPQEITRHLHVPVIGNIPVLPLAQLEKMSQAKKKGSERIASSLVTVHQPRSSLAESYRSVRTALYYSTRGKGHQVIQVTSPNPGDGKSTLSTNLAASIAQSGKKCLILDCDLRRPRIHTHFNVDRSIGLSSVINNECEISDVIQSTGIDNLWCVTSGPKVDNPAELITSSRFDEILDVFSQKFDFVIIDTPPLLAVTDPATISARAHGVIMTLRINGKTQPIAQRCKEILDHMGANLIGVVVNGIGSGEYTKYQVNNYSYYSGGYNSYTSISPEFQSYYTDDLETADDVELVSKPKTFKLLETASKKSES